MRSIFHLALLIPALAGAAPYAGTIASLENHPLAGVVVKLGSDSVITGNAGTWSLARSAGIRSREAKAIDGTRHLIRDGTRLSLTWQDRDILGRDQAMRENPPTNRPAGIGARKMASVGADTIVISWKGRKLSRIPVFASDTTIAQVIDTAWSDDAGIPWNPRFAYASLLDTRNHRTYRAITIGNQTWMAENLNYAVDSSWMPSGNADSAIRYGRFYNWSAAAALDKGCQTAECIGQVKSSHPGICPNGWHLPDSSAWAALDSLAQTLPETGSRRAGIALKAASGWIYASSYPTKDLLGFRALSAGDGAGFWSSTETGAQEAGFYGIASDQDYGFEGSVLKRDRESVRCLKTARNGDTSLGTTASPSFSPVGGIYTAPQMVTLYSATSGATIYYTMDGSAPTTSLDAFSGTIKVGTSLTIKAVAVNNGVSSTESSATYSVFSKSSLAPWNASITYGKLTDTRDGKEYRTVSIGKQTWMAENLDYAGADGTTGLCHNANADSCIKYGRLYGWSEMMDGASPSSAAPSGVKGLCPTGWHVPSDTEWTAMATYADTTNAISGKILKATSGWYGSGNGTDAYGFRALAGGDIYAAKSFNIGTLGLWWTASDDSHSAIRIRTMSASDDAVSPSTNDKTCEFSLRCVQDRL